MALIIEGVLVWIVLYGLYQALRESHLSIYTTILLAIGVFIILPIPLKVLLVIITIVYTVIRLLASVMTGETK